MTVEEWHVEIAGAVSVFGSVGDALAWAAGQPEAPAIVWRVSKTAHATLGVSPSMPWPAVQNPAPTWIAAPVTHQRVQRGG